MRKKMETMILIGIGIVFLLLGITCVTTLQNNRMLRFLLKEKGYSDEGIKNIIDNFGKDDFIEIR